MSKLSYYLILAAASLIYMVLTVFGPINPHSNTFNLSVNAVHLLQLTLVIPIIAIWFTALYGAVRFKAYTRSIAASKDGSALSRISDGLLILVLAVVTPSLVSSLRSYFPDQIPMFEVISTYLTIGITLGAFWLIYRGSCQLLNLIAVDKQPKVHDKLITYTIVGILAVFYFILLFNDDYRNATPDPATITSYYMPDWLILLTVGVPYVVTWIWGSSAVANLRAYGRGVAGVVYRQSLHALGLGIGMVIFFSILGAFLNAAGPIFQHAGLGQVLILVYLIIVAYAAGYLVIAYGARKLSKIEEVVG